MTDLPIIVAGAGIGGLAAALALPVRAAARSCWSARTGCGSAGVTPQALTAYCDLRRLRIARVQLQSHAIGDHIYHPAGVHAACEMRC
jgi:hypothetical protein